MRKASTTLFMGVALMLLSAVAAWACTNLATLNLSQSQVAAGATIDVTGTSFRTADRGGQDVVIHWNGVDGAVLATVTPDATGNIATQVAIPADARPGYHVLVATQNQVDDETGEVSVAYGTPARASVLIGSASAAEALEPAQPAALVAPETGSSGMIALTALLAVLGIGLFGAGLGLFVREVRRRGVPAPVRSDD